MLRAFRRLGLYTFCGVALGWLAGSLDYDHTNGLAIFIAGFFAMPVLNLLMIYRGLYVPILKGLAINYFGIIISWIALITIYTKIFSQDSYYQSYDPWLVFGLTLAALIIHLPIAAILISWTMLDEGRIRTTNCLGCGYSLIGLSEKKCPECGKPYTLHEQGVSENDLSIR